MAVLGILYSHALHFSRGLGALLHTKRGKEANAKVSALSLSVKRRSVQQAGRKAGSPAPPFAQLLFMIPVSVVS